MDPRMNKGEYNFGERDGSARPNEAGVYYHPHADKFVETSVLQDSQGNPMIRDGQPIYPKDQGKIQADAFTQIGYRPATEEELKRFRAQQEENRKAARIEASRKTTAMSSK